MNPQPVQESKVPSYPTRREVLAGAAGFALANLCGPWRVFAATKDGKAIVAPIFEHGEGRGATGCIVVSPPVFLSEEEAMQIIREELGKHGVQLKGEIVLKEVRTSRRVEIFGSGENRIEELDEQRAPILYALAQDNELRSRMAPRPLKLNGVDLNRKVAVEVISETNYFALGGPASDSSVQDYRFKEIAESVVAKVKKQCKEPIYLGVFYDPLVGPNRRAVNEKSEKEKISFEDAWKKAEDESKSEARKLLRLQVQDFAAWLKEKKVIDK
jgi:hypothetical protein